MWGNKDKNINRKCHQILHHSEGCEFGGNLKVLFIERYGNTEPSIGVQSPRACVTTMGTPRKG